MKREKKTGVLLVNLGTPLSPKPRDVYRYLIEFLTDPRVIDLPWLRRQLLVRGFIVPARYRQSAKAYEQIWTKEGSPLMVYGKRVQKEVEKQLGEDFFVELAMRYQEPSIEQSLGKLMDKEIDHLIVLPLFPQYASATTGSVHQRVQEILGQYQVIPKVTLLSHYASHPLLINAFCKVASQCEIETYDHLLFSFHGLPERHIHKADKHSCCLKTSTCCNQVSNLNKNCYKAQCYDTALAIVEGLGLPKEKFSICFQSRLGRDPWLQPYASNRIAELAKEGKKRVLVMSPSFVCDCLETIFEIKVEYAAEFIHAGGEKLDLVPGLNDHPLWIETIKTIVTQNSN